MPKNGVVEARSQSCVTAGDNQEFRLVGKRCADCGRVAFPGFEVCPGCQGEQLQSHPLSPSGTLYTWSVVHIVPKPWTAPLVIGYVDLPENVRVFAHLGADPAALRIDMRVCVEPAMLGVDAEGRPRSFFRFVPATTAQHA